MDDSRLKVSLTCSKPVSYTHLYLNEEFFKQWIPFIKLAGTLISEYTLIPVSDSIYISLKEIMTNLPEALEKTENMNVGLNFVVENN